VSAVPARSRHARAAGANPVSLRVLIKRLLPYWSRIGRRLAQRLYDLLRLKKL
jgi:hypothetical protein